jgi:hypothetical protein
VSAGRDRLLPFDPSSDPLGRQSGGGGDGSPLSAAAERGDSLKGLRILRGVRNSTPAQRGNWRSREQEDGRLDARLAREGAVVVPFDEQGTSGRELSKRRVFRETLGKIDRGEADGIAFEDVKRLTRHELGIDGGVIARHLIEARAVFVTSGKTYYLWREDDLLDFQFQCLISGIDVRGIRRQMWDGVLRRADEEPFFMGKPPIGYATRPEVDPVTSEVRKRVPIKDPAQAALMAALTAALDDCATLSEVCARLNRAGLMPLRRYRRSGALAALSGQPTPWQPITIKLMFASGWYVGYPRFGRNPERTSKGALKSPVWELAEGKRLDFGGPQPQLAYWTLAQVRRWHATFCDPARPAPHARFRGYQHPLNGILRCGHCGRPMGAFGRHGYRCASRGNGLCAHPQHLRERAALAAIREILPEVWVSSRALLAAAREADGANRRLAQARADLAMREEVAAANAEAWRTQPPGELKARLFALLGEDEAELARLRTEVELLSGAAEATDLEALGAVLERDPYAVWDHPEVTDTQRARIAALLLRAVTVRTWARGKSARFTVAAYAARVRGAAGVELLRRGVSCTTNAISLDLPAA